MNSREIQGRHTVARISAITLFLSQAILLVACSGGVEGEPRTGEVAEGSTSPARKEVHAPIESAEVIVRESAPPQYALRVISGLPSGCAKFGRIEQKSQGDVLEVTVWNSVPADDDVVCTMIYGTADNTVDLESHFESGKTYDVRVNGEVKAQFTAQ